MTTDHPNPRALARSLEACRQHVIDALVDIERAAARGHRDAYRAAERALGRGLVRLAEIADEAPAMAAIADDVTARQLEAAAEVFAAIAEAAANLPPPPRRTGAHPASPARCLRGRLSRSARTRTTISLDTSR